MHEDELKIGDKIQIAIYVSDKNGMPVIKWENIVVDKLPLFQSYPTYVTFKKIE